MHKKTQTLRKKGPCSKLLQRQIEEQEQNEEADGKEICQGVNFSKASTVARTIGESSAGEEHCQTGLQPGLTCCDTDQIHLEKEKNICLSYKEKGLTKRHISNKQSYCISGRLQCSILHCGLFGSWI